MRDGRQRPLLFTVLRSHSMGAHSYRLRLPPYFPEAKRTTTTQAAVGSARLQDPTSPSYLYQIGRITVKNKVLIACMAERSDCVHRTSFSANTVSGAYAKKFRHRPHQLIQIYCLSGSGHLPLQSVPVLPTDTAECRRRACSPYRRRQDCSWCQTQW
jgi:hypothetical protein